MKSPLTNNLADGLQTASGGLAGEQAQSAALSADIASYHSINIEAADSRAGQVVRPRVGNRENQVLS